jgi:two-component system chemotaxis response regulator CheB
MVVDDSAVIRGLIVRTLERDAGIEVVATCANGQAAVLQAPRAKPDVIVLDIEMPIMDGLTALPKLLAVDRDVKIIIASTLSQRNAQISLKALGLGAADYIPKPTASQLGASEDFHRELVGKVNALGRRKVRKAAFSVTRKTGAAPASAPIQLRKPGPVVPRIVAVGSSTGGPQALTDFVKGIPATFKAPILITQHMPPTFTPALAEHLGRMAGRPCREGLDGEPIHAGQIYLAPGDFHMEVTGDAVHPRLRLTQAPQEHYCRPSVNPLWRTGLRVYGSGLVAVMLTGMGNDGIESGREIAKAGGILVAQDEATSVVWGMPGAVATAGLCTAVLPLKEIAPHIVSVFAGECP